MAWAVGSAALGAAAFAGALALLWRDFPGLPAPAGELSAHALSWGQCAINAVAPALFESEAAQYGRLLKGLAERGELSPLVWRVGPAALAAILPAIALASEHLPPRDALLHLRGGRRHSGRRALSLLNRKLRAAVRRRPDHFIHPEIQYPAGMWTRHVLVVGGVGSGKSRLVMPLVARVIARDEKLIAFDPKGELTAAFGKPALIAPWDERSLAWDIAKDLQNLGDIRAFARAVIPDDPQPFWVNAARQILVGLIRWLKALYGERWGWAELEAALRLPDKDLLGIMEEHNPEAARPLRKLGPTSQGILSTLSAHCSVIFDLSAAWGNAPEGRRVSFKEWALIEPRHRQIFIQGHGSYPQLSEAVAKGIISVIGGIVSSPELQDSFERKLWFIADEFAQMGKATALSERICAVGRSKGCRVVMATQDFAQLQAIHGKEAVDTLMGMCGTLVVGQTGPGATAQALCSAIGSREVERRGISVSQSASGAASSVSFSREDLALYKPSELATRLGPTPDGKSAVMALATGGDVYELAWPIEPLPKARPAHIAAAWVSAGAGPLSLLPAALAASIAGRSRALKALAIPSASGSDEEDPFAELDALWENDGALGGRTQPSSLGSVAP